MNLANKLTLLRVLLVPVFMILALSDFPYSKLLAALVFILASITDVVDGYVARKRQEVTNLGKLMDPLADKLLVTAAIVVLVETGYISSWVAVVIIGREFLVTGLRGVAAAEGVVIAASNLAKLKTIIQVVALSALLLDDYISAFAGFSPGIWILYVAVLFTVYTGYDYFVKTLKQINIR